METATIVTQGQVQSVQLPPGVRMDGEEVFVKRVGKTVLLIPKDSDPWDLMAESLDQFTEDFLEDRAQPPEGQQGALFD